MGLFDFLGFGKREKPNLTPHIQYPNQGQLNFTDDSAKRGGYSLRSLAESRIRSANTGNIEPGIGYGEDFVSKTTNPAIAKLDASFRESTLPRISSEASKRGIARSSLVTDQISKAEQSKNRDVADLISQFYYLNKQQEKADINAGIGLGERLNQEQADLMTGEAAAAERQVGRNVEQANARNARADVMRDRTLQGIGSVGSNFFGSKAGQDILNSLGLNKAPSVSTGPRVNLLGSMSDSDFENWLNSFLGEGA